MKLVAAGLVQIVQSPGPGNWTKTKPPPYIARVYPNFDAPASSRVKTSTNGRRAPLRASPAAALPNAVAHDLRSKWEAYYRDTRLKMSFRRIHRVNAGSTHKGLAADL
jgi:hypothetical protein